MAKSINVHDIINYANITLNSRNLVEAERLLKSNFIITFGATQVSENAIEIFALCLKTSNMQEEPHTITGTIQKKICSGYEIGYFHCTCKAGAAVCKHKTAVLLMCYQ